MKRQALVSVSDKTGLATFSEALAAFSFEILSSSGSFRYLQENNIPAKEISAYTGFPEILEGRVKTLHPKIYAGILAKHPRNEIDPIDLVVVNLYPFEQKIETSTLNVEEAMDWIDIGGSALIRAAAKNHAFVTVIVSPTDYPLVLEELQKTGVVSEKTRFLLAMKAFAYTAHYDKVIADYFEQQQNPLSPFLPTLRLEYQKTQDLRYGENPHQKAAFYIDGKGPLASIQQLQGKPLSFNNIVDSDAALACIQTFQEPACVIVKHTNPCGVALGHTILEAYQKAYTTDPISAFGGIIAFNQCLDKTVAEEILNQQFVEIILAPSITEPAQRLFIKKPNIRVLLFKKTAVNMYELKQVQGGVLLQERDIKTTPALHVVTKKTPSPEVLRDLKFAWIVAQYVKSNAIVYARHLQTLGVGAGQMSRIDSVRIASQKAKDAGLNLKDAVMASDAFFPFRDSVDLAASMEIGAIIQPGGSTRDEEVISAANEQGISMVFTGIRHFRH